MGARADLGGGARVVSAVRSGAVPWQTAAEGRAVDMAAASRTTDLVTGFFEARKEAVEFGRYIRNHHEVVRSRYGLS